MPGYLDRLRRMSPAHRMAEIDEKICDTYGDICRDPAFRAVADPSFGPWIADQYTVSAGSEAVELIAGELHVPLEYTALGCADDFILRGQAVAVINDAGTVRYMQVPPEEARLSRTLVETNPSS